MSRSFISRSRNQNTVSNHSNELQKKVDPQAQLDWIHNQKVDQGWGIQDFQLNENELAQMYSNNQVAQQEAVRVGTTVAQAKDKGEVEEVPSQIIINGQLFNYYKTVLMEANEVVIQISLEFAGEKLTKSAENTLAGMRAAGYKSGSNGKLYKTKVFSRQKWINGELKWIKEGKNIGNKSFTTKGLELSTTKTTLKKELGIALKEFGGAAVDLADMMVCAEKGNVLDALPTAMLVDMEAERINEILNDVSEKLLSEKILEGSKSVSDFLRENYSLSKKYELIEADSNTVDGILNMTILTYSQLLESIYNNTEEKRNSVLYRKDSEDLNIIAIIENK